MAENEETLHTVIDDHADTHLSELKARVDQARAQVDRAGSAITAKLNPDAASAAPQARQAASPPLERVPEMPAEPSVSPPASASVDVSASFADQLAKRVPQTPVVHDASDFGDIAANLATDDDWKNA